MESIALLGRQIPNLISILRIVLVYPYVTSFLAGQYKVALAIFAISAISDAFDGLLARRYNWRTQIGMLLDPIADKLLLMISFFIMWLTGFFPVWLFSIVLLRDGLILVCAVFLRLTVGQYTAGDNTQVPLFSGKLNTFVQLTVVILMLVNLAIYPLSKSLLTACFYLTVGLCFYSGFGYLRLFILKLLTHKRTVNS
jgi:cardiolipin synthase